MSIFHDVYLFKPECFLKTIVSYAVASRKDVNGYALLRTAAIKLYDTVPQVKFLASEYGGWDKSSLLTQLPPNYSQNPEDIAFWFTIMLYGYCRVKDSATLGLGKQWRIANTALKTIAWAEPDRKRLIMGNAFSLLFRKGLSTYGIDSHELDMRYLDFIGSFSQGGHAGWVSFQEVQSLLDKMIHDKHRFANAVRSLTVDSELGYEIYDMILKMLNMAVEINHGLCIIISG